MPIDPELTKKILKKYKRGQVPVSGRPADYLERRSKRQKKILAILPATMKMCWHISYIPRPWKKFLRTKYGIDSPASAGVENFLKKKLPRKAAIKEVSFLKRDDSIKELSYKLMPKRKTKGLIYGLSLNENQLTYLDTVRKFVKNEITPHILDLEKVMFSVEHH